MSCCGTFRRCSPRAEAVRAALLLGLLLLAQAAAAGSAGEDIYRRGVLPSGAPLHGARQGNPDLVGADAACISCHRRSGLGTVEGRITIPPITGAYLFRPANARIDDESVHYVGTSRVRHQPYTPASLAAAIREGVGADGRSLSYLMPRYALDDAALAQLTDYLRQLTPRAVPGVSDTVLHFATIFTPEAGAARRQGTLEVLEKYFLDKNAAARAVAPRLYATRPMMFRVTRKWQLHVWDLTGPPAQWGNQLRQHLAAEPVFAVISGAGGAHWEPVHRFCEEQSLPCLFPNVEAPPDAQGDFYALYFSQGVRLEAGLIAQALGATGPTPVQVYRAGDSGAVAARALRARLAEAGRRISDVVLPAHAPLELAGQLKSLTAGAPLVLWLQPADLRALPAPPAGSTVYLSGLMAGLEEAPLPGPWRAQVRMTYPFELPERRRARVDYAFGWFSIRKIPIVAMQAQVDTYLACGLLSETLNHMVETFERDYLVERIEEGLEHRVLTGYYPRLSLAPGQRFASKGGYLVRFSAGSGVRIAPLGEWQVP